METQAKTVQAVYPALRYNNAKAAIAWLTSVLGFEAHEVCAGEGDAIEHAELKIGSNLIMLGSVKPDSFGRSPQTVGAVTSTVYVGLETADDVDARYRSAKAAGSRILREPIDTDYGSHEFTVSDPEGHIWSFGTYRPQAT